MKKKYKIIALLFIVVAFVGCARNAISGRKQLKMFGEPALKEMALQEYRQFLSNAKVSNANTNKDAEMVRRIGGRIAKAVTEYYTIKGHAEVFEGYNWEFNLVDDKQVNAWCMPGGKVVVYTGLLPITQNEAALAVVMGHEIAHALLTHGNERMSQGAIMQGLQVAGNVVLAKDQQTVNLFNNIFGIGAQAGYLLPNSRKQELEADRFGLIFSAMAGYNPQESIPLWQRMEKASAGAQKPPEWLSTHPAESTRIEQLTKYMEEALKYYKPMNVGK